MEILIIEFSFILLGCGDEKDMCVAELLDDCPVTFNIDYVCGCDDVTYVNPSVAECHQIYTYTEGSCDE